MYYATNKTMDTTPKHCKIREECLRHLSASGDIKSLSTRFGALNSNHARVDFALDLLDSCKVEIDFVRDAKSDETALKLRKQGNEMFKRKQLKEAWELYTKSICSAEEGVNLGLAYANRSAVLLEANLHEECLSDIERALENNYPEDLKSKLFLRRKKCVVDGNKATPFEPVDFRSDNGFIKCASSSIAVKEDMNFGRFVVATRDIKVGEVLAVEQPFALLVVNQHLNHCHECVKLCYNLVPCKNCTLALYCSDNCRVQALKYHRFECPVLATLRSYDFDKLKLLPLKIALMVKKPEQTPPTDGYCSGRYHEIHNLVSNTSKRSPSDLFQRSFAAALICKILEKHSQFFAENSAADFKEILLLHMQTGPSNFHEITEASHEDLYQLEEVASGAFAFLSLLNHSCDPNVTRVCHGARIALRAIRNIAAGGQCFDNYGYHFALMPKSERLARLKSQYYFDCACPACEHNWPMYEGLPGNNLQLEEELVSELSQGNLQTARCALDRFILLMGELAQPGRDFCRVQELVKQCFILFGNKRRVF